MRARAMWQELKTSLSVLLNHLKDETPGMPDTSCSLPQEPLQASVFSNIALHVPRFRQDPRLRSFTIHEPDGMTAVLNFDGLLPDTRLNDLIETGH